MKKRILLSATLLTFLISQLTVMAADKFPSNTDDFMKQLKDYMAISKQKDMIAVYDDFEQEFMKGSYAEKEMELIIQVSNKMLGHKMKAKPYFGIYLKGLTSYKKNECTYLSFGMWHDVLGGMLEDVENRKFNAYQKFLAFCYKFFEDNVLHQKKGSIEWKVFVEKVTMTYADRVPHMSVSEVDLVCLRKKETIKIQETSGTFYPLSNLWKGEGGEVNWSRLDTDMREVFCEFSKYEIDVTKGLYEAKNAKLYYPELFGNTPVTGTFQDKIMVTNKALEGSYPRFESNEKIISIQNLAPNVSYVGGFKLLGKKMFGYGDAKQKAMIKVRNSKNELALKAASQLFIIKRGELISGEEVKATLLVGNDSIYHPSVNLKYTVDGQSLILQRGERGSNRNPFYSSFHNFNIDAEKVDWKLNEDRILINEKKVKVGTTNKKVTFESLHYFDVQDYRKQQNVADKNPIAVIKLLSEKENTKQIPASFIAKALNPNFDVSSIERMLYDLVSKAYINYDKETKIVEVKDKIFHYADAAMDKVDFDVIKIKSDSEKTNGVFDLKSKDILVNDVQVLEFSHVRKVAAKPHKEQLVLQQNRNIAFDGKLFASLSYFEGKDFIFDYEKFHIKMDSIRYFDLFVPDGTFDKKGEPVAWSMASRIEHLNGYLLIDAPKNKSGKQKIKNFPSFQSKGNSYVYYENKKTQDGIYERDSFYFKLDPFSFNDLTFFNQSDIHFKGEMFSDDIFPVFKETLVLQEEDQSLGFTTQTPAEGFSTYNNRGNFQGEISMSDKGMLGKGKVTYRWASVDSEDIIFKPKQMLSTAEEFSISEERSSDVPKIYGENVSVNWKPYQDSMYIQAEDEPFKLFQNGEHTVFDLLILTPDGVKGRGDFKWDLGNMKSDLYSFGTNSVETDTADMAIKASGVQHLALNTNNVRAKMDFDQQMGYVKANEASTLTTLPYNKYVTSLNEYDWNIKQENITFKSEENKLGSFLSIHPQQDSLFFVGATAFYDLKTNELKVGGVPVIETADALVYPNEGNVDIRPDGLIPTLENAKIIANTKNKYHVINRAKVDILGKRLYKATGFYEYNLGDKIQEIEFTNILGGPVGKGKKKEKELVTVAKGKVKDGQQFYIDTKTLFQGSIELRANEPNLYFDGFAKLDATKLPNANWFSIQSKGDKNDLAIEYDTPKDLNGQPVRTGLFIDKASGTVYPAIMNALHFRKDRLVFESKGLFKYDKNEDIFYMGDSLKVVSGVKKGNLFTFSDKDGNIKMEGQFNLGPSIDEVNVTAVGSVETNIEQTDAMTLNLMAGIRIHFPDELLSMVANDLSANAFDASTILYRPYERYEKAMAEVITDSKALATQIAEMKSIGKFQIPAVDNTYDFYFSKLPMEWNQEYQSFLSKDNKIGIESVAGRPINKMIETYMECKMLSSGDDRLYLYIKSPGGTYYYFGYKQGILEVASNNEEFNLAVEGMKKKDATKKMKGGETYEIVPGTEAKANMFLNRVKSGR